MIDEILSQPALKEKPPVFIDVGASGEIHPIWNDVAKYAVCIAFDADTRKFSIEEKHHEGYRKLYLINKIVTADGGECDFYLTKSPYCSSVLEPDKHALEDWYYSDLFTVERTMKLESTTLQQALDHTGIDYVDWFKTDSQGTDLRILKSLADKLVNRMILCILSSPL